LWESESNKNLENAVLNEFAEAGIDRGDAGGPLPFNLPVTGWTVGGVLSGHFDQPFGPRYQDHASTGSGRSQNNPAWLIEVLGSGDLDGDGIVDAGDNCPPKRCVGSSPRDLHFSTPPVALDNQGEPDFWSNSMIGLGDQAMWIESTPDRERIRSYSQAGGVRVEIDRAPGFVLVAAFDGERLSGTTQEVPLDIDDGSTNVGLWTRDPVSGEIRTSSTFRTSSRANPGRLRAADDWAVLSLIGTERLTDPTTGHSTRVPILPDGSEDTVLVVNLGTWAAHRIPVPAGRAVLNDSIGTDGTHVYVSLRDAAASTFQTDELRRYPLARIQEWGTPWIDE
jgi:hypothetical protein